VFISFKISNLCDPDPPTLQMDGRCLRTDDVQSQFAIPRFALVYRAVKIRRYLFTYLYFCIT